MAQETTKDTAPDSTLGKAQSMVKTDFSELHAAMRRLVDGDFIPSVSTAVINQGEVVDAFFYGDADRESKTPLNAEHLFRAYSNTKLVTSLAALLLWEEGRFDWDDPIEKFIPELGQPPGGSARCQRHLRGRKGQVIHHHSPVDEPHLGFDIRLV